MRGQTSVVLLSIAALMVSCTSSNETSSAPTTSTTSPAGKNDSPPVVTPLLASILAAPIPVPATDGKVHLAYELHLTNVLNQELTLTSVDVRATERTVLSLEGDRLAYWTRALGNPTPTTKLGPAQSAAGWLDVALDPGATVPAELVHAVGVSVPQPQPPLFPATLTETVAPVTVQTHKPAVIAPPLIGPHLHFQVMSTADPLRSDGLPFVFSSFTLDGRIAAMDAEDAVAAGQPAPMQPRFARRHESAVSPLVLDVMSYAG